ncbi:hypothetical protein S7711_04117 [Stachybotrys chartarum IBT 7711]|uniref:RNA-dependent RNA polymerase n=1 Tax=Stachybotrys chartarum (strain CBS 109288 / IBT 7711) TaxID=1280523 RepID=A0A084AR77_STACB|nr:hypothetical protein S7711_04117 [Stachybotrys chartarum IBT 7711]
MDVFLRNLPARLTDKSLSTQLATAVEALGIEDWDCQKFGNKTFGILTFLRPQDGERFLQKHGQRPFIAQTPLVILGNIVQCQRSNKPLNPFVIKSLTRSADERRQPVQKPVEAPEGKVIFDLSRLSCGYFEYAGQELSYTMDILWTPDGGWAKFAKRMLVMEFTIGDDKSRVEIPYRIVESIVYKAGQFTITLWESPRFFDLGLASLAASADAYAPCKHRQTQLSGGSASNHHDVLGQALIYRLDVSPNHFETTMRRLSARYTLPLYQGHIPLLPSSPNKLANGLQEFKRTIQDSTKTVPFGLLYQMEALVKNGFLLPWTVQALLRKLTQLCKAKRIGPTSKDPPISPAAVKKLFAQIPFASSEVDPSVFEVDELWRQIEENEEQIRNGSLQGMKPGIIRENRIPVYRVNITPTKMMLHGPDPEAKNRILRRFADHPDYFIRVQFCEEDGTDVQFSANISNSHVYQRFKKVFRDGINIGGRIYGFLGFSHSSLRSHSAWFMATFSHEGSLVSYFTVISKLGSFENIYSPARCAARIGQAFSETPLAISLVEHGVSVKRIPDIKSDDGDRVFSDGVGTISQSLALAIQANTQRHDDAATCFQIRWAGAKGMLAVDPRLEGNAMCVRGSMIKFQSSDIANLEICDMANKPIPMVLNRQMIKILEDMGIPNDWFFRQQSFALDNLRSVTETVENTAKFMKGQNIGHGMGFPRFLRRLWSFGIDYRRDRFLSSLVEAAVLRELRLLKHKARIPIRHGVTLFGIMDEFGYLEDGQVYVAFDDEDFIHDRSNNLHNRRMIITRSPALHPGDIQLATNIVPPLSHPLRVLRNCLVFSQKGKRDLPSCLSGGDLDGDTYGIIWDHDAVRQVQRTYSPADYPRVEPVSIGRAVQREDMTDFYIQFMETNKLGLIAVRHMILADQQAKGTEDPGCLLLASMHSTAVDYSKTGKPVDMDEFKKIKTNRYRPDFLAPAPPTKIVNRNEISFENPADDQLQGNEDEDDNTGPTHNYYASDKINGLLFRAIDERQIWSHNVKTRKPSVLGDLWDETQKSLRRECLRILRDNSWRALEQEAWNVRSFYEDAVWNLSLEFSDNPSLRITELEVFTGAIFNATGVQTRRQRDRSIQLKDEFASVVQQTEAVIRKKSARPPGEQLDEAQMMAHCKTALRSSMACLNVACFKEKEGRSGWRRVDEVFQSFKVIAACCVIKELDVWSKLEEGLMVGQLKRKMIVA